MQYLWCNICTVRQIHAMSLLQVKIMQCLRTRLFPRTPGFWRKVQQIILCLHFFRSADQLKHTSSTLIGQASMQGL